MKVHLIGGGSRHLPPKDYDSFVQNRQNPNFKSEWGYGHALGVLCEGDPPEKRAPILAAREKIAHFLCPNSCGSLIELQDFPDLLVCVVCNFKLTGCKDTRMNAEQQRRNKEHFVVIIPVNKSEGLRDTASTTPQFCPTWMEG